ncbi:SHOCT domain-containing protein [Streptomyces sp. NPDC091292]|uniref:SHOCT domain-containing protein n=1 Tax=Streptomyces sp. NPDC091292 TaxID=3365991 RepID=UPI0037FF4E60
MQGYVNLAYDYPVLGAFWTVMWIFLWVIWLIVLFRAVADVFRAHDMKGWTKCAWLLFMLIVPFIGVLCYVVVHGADMGKRDIEQQKEWLKARDATLRDYSAAQNPQDHAEQLAKISELRTKGDLTEAEFQQAKAKILQ